MTKEEILEKHYRNFKKRIAYEDNVLAAMDEFAEQQVKLCNIPHAIKSVCNDFMSDFSDTNICLWCEHTKKEHA